jgi:hypothetical protein
MNIFTYMFYSKEVAFEQSRYESITKKLKDNLAVLTTKINDANYFLWRKRKCKIILSLKFEKRFNMKN